MKIEDLALAGEIISILGGVLSALIDNGGLAVGFIVLMILFSNLSKRRSKETRFRKCALYEKKER